MDKCVFIKLLTDLKKVSLTKFEKDLLFSKQIMNFEDIFKLSEEALDDILNTEKVELKISKMYFYTSEDNLPKDIQENFKAELENNNNLYMYLKIMEKFADLERKDGLDCVRIIMNAKGSIQKDCAYQLATNNYVLTKEDSMVLIKKAAMQEDSSLSKFIKDEVLEEQIDFYYNSNLYPPVYIEIEKSVKDLINYESLSDLLIGLPRTNESNVSLDTKIKIKVKK